MGTGIGCTVYADGVRVADGSPGDEPSAPTVLSGLSVSWGRETTVDQPETSTCAFTLMDELGGQTFLDLLRTGTPIDVTASGTVYPDPSVPVWPDPGFDTGALPGVTPINADVGIGQNTPAPPDGDVRTNQMSDPACTSSLWTRSNGAGVTSTVERVTGADDGPVITETGQQVTSYIRATVGSVGTSGLWVRFDGASALTAAAGEQVTVSFYARRSAGGTVRTIVVQGGNTVDPSGELTAQPGEWVRVPVTVTARAGVVTARCTAAALSTVGETFDITACLVESAADVGAYFDGDTPDTETTDYAWTGDAAASTSTATPLAVPDTRGNYLRVDVGNAAKRSGVLLAPAPFVPPNTSPDAWDGVRTTLRGQTWSYGCDVLAMPGAVVTIKPVLWTGPYQGAYDIPNLAGLTVQGTGEWQSVTGTFVPNVDGAWVGLQVTYYPVGPTWDELDPAWTWDTVDPATLTWADMGALLVDNIAITAPDGGAVTEVLVYSGRVVSMTEKWDDGPDCPVIAVSCVDFTADLENINIGDDPWPVEPMAARFTRVIDLAGLPVTADIAPTVASIPISWRDADSTAAAGLLTELASSVDAVMWSAVHTVSGPYLLVEDPAARASQALIVLDADTGLIVIVPNPLAPGGLEISACDVLRDDVEWTQDVQDVMTRAAVQWKEQGTDESGKTTTTDRTVTLIDTALEAAHGVRRISLSTELQAAADAETVAQKLLARTSAQDWRASGLTIDDAALDDPDDEDTLRLLTLLDGTSRNGLPVTLTDLPWWSPGGSPLAVYLEGGSYAFTDGAWLLDLTVSNSTGQGVSATWDELDPAWTWDQWDPAVTWDDLRGAAGPNPTASIQG